MAIDNTLLQECGTINRVCAAFFITEAEKFGVNFADSKPQISHIASLNEDGHFFNEYHAPHGLKDLFRGRIHFDNLDMEKIRSRGLIQAFEETMQEKLSYLAKTFAFAIEKNKYCDLVFSSLPDCVPYIFDSIRDPDTNFRCSLTIGKNFGRDNYEGIFEFFCLLMVRFRNVEDHPIYGQSCLNVDVMTDEERAKYNKQPTSE